MSKVIQVRDIDDSTYIILRRRATKAGLSLAAYIRRELDRIAELEPLENILDQLDQFRSAGPATEEIVDALYQTREERTHQLCP